MRVTCIAVPRFLVEVERLHERPLRGRPVVVGGAWNDPKAVLDCSPEASASGVRPGMPLREALSRCPGAAFVEARPERYRVVTLAMVHALLEVSPLVEPATPGVIYLGVDGQWQGSGSPVLPRPLNPDPLEEGLAETIMAVTEGVSGLKVHVGIADGKFGAYVAAMLGRGVRIVPLGEGAAFLADLPVDDLPVSAEMRRRLWLFGLRTLRDLARLPKGAVATQFGAEGGRAWELAHGLDRAPIVPYRPPRAVIERLAFPAPVDTWDVLLGAMRTLLGRILDRPEMRGRAARGLRLRVHLEDGHVWEHQVTFREPTSSGGRMLLTLQAKLGQGPHPGGGAPPSRMRAGALPEEGSAASRVGSAPALPGGSGSVIRGPQSAFTEVELAVLDLCGESALQGSLFVSERGRQIERLAEAARQLKARYGRPILSNVMEVEPWSRIPERRFALIDYDP